MSDGQDNQPQIDFKSAFKRAAGKILSPLVLAFKKSSDATGLTWLATNYPSKAAAGTGLLGDLSYGCHAYFNQGDSLGVMSSAIGSITCLVLMYYGDPKKKAEEAKDFIEPQDVRTWKNVFKSPEKYVWENVGYVRLGTHGVMLAGGLGYSLGDKVNQMLGFNEAVNGGGPVMQPDVIAYAACVMAGYGIKLWYRQAPPGSVIPPEFKNDPAGWVQAKTQENPNRTAGWLWNGISVPFVINALIGGDYLKAGVAGFGLLPNTFTALSNKRTKIIPAVGPTPKQG